MTLGERIKKVRKSLDLTQQKFASQIGTTQNNIASYEIGRREPSAAAVNNICKTFNVSETWLRTGDGEMFIKRTRNDELTTFVNELLSEETPDFRRRLVTALARLKPEQWDALEAVALELMNIPAAPASAPAPVDTQTQAKMPDLAADLEEIKQQQRKLAAEIDAIKEEDCLSMERRSEYGRLLPSM